MRTTLVVAAVALPCLVLPGCTSECSAQCGVLPPAVRLTVRDAVDGGPVVDAVANGFPCPGFCDLRLPDGGSIQDPGTFPVSVEAAGYQPQSSPVTVPARADPGFCCPVSYVPQDRDVRLVPL
jgi:hypothetical protein